MLTLYSFSSIVNQTNNLNSSCLCSKCTILILNKGLAPYIGYKQILCLCSQQCIYMARNRNISCKNQWKSWLCRIRCNWTVSWSRNFQGIFNLTVKRANGWITLESLMYCKKNVKLHRVFLKITPNHACEMCIVVCNKSDLNVNTIVSNF